MIGIDNAITWAHLQARGGWIRFASAVGIYALVIGALLLMSLSLGDPVGRSSTLMSWTAGLLLLSNGILGLFGTGRINLAIRQDLASKIVESNRLMPIHPVAAAGAYLVGPVIGVLGISLATLAIGCYTAPGGGIPIANWIFANLLCGLSIFLLWTLAGLAAFINKGGIAVAVVGPLLVASLNPSLSRFVPAIQIFNAPLYATFAQLYRGFHPATLPLFVGILAQLAMALIFFAGMARRYVRADAAPLGPFLCLLLLFVLLAVSYVGLLYPDFLYPSRRYRGEITTLDDQLTASLLLMLGAAFLPIFSISARWHRRYLESVWSEEPHPAEAPVLIVVAIATGMVMLVVLPFAAKANLTNPALAMLSLTCLTTLLSYAFVSRLIAYRKRFGGFLVLLWLVGTLAAPMLVEWAQFMAANSDDNYAFGKIAAISPIAMIIELLHPDGGLNVLHLGICVQVALSIITGVLFYRRVVQGQKRAKAAMMGADAEREPAVV